MTKVNISARVTLTVEMPANGTWGGECSASQVHDQAGEETKRKLESLIRDSEGKVIGEPKVVAVLVERS